MTPPRDIRPGQTFEITSRTLNRAFFFPPILAITNLFLFVLGHFAAKHGVVIYGVVLMANHYHLLGLDVRGVLPGFVRDLNSVFARALNVFHRKDDKIWSGDGYHIVRPINPEDVFSRLVYLASNPASAHLVNRAQDFPGVVTTPSKVGKPVVANRPKFFFREDGPWPKEVTVTFEVPECLEMSRSEYVRAFDEALRLREQQIRGERRAARKSVLGSDRCRRMRVWDRPRSPERYGRRKRPIACQCEVSRTAALARLRRFRDEYRAAREVWSEGRSDVAFPPGTWWVVQFAGAAIREGPD